MPQLVVLDVTSVQVVIRNKNTGGQSAPLAEFVPLVSNVLSSAALAAGPGANPGATWFGFSGEIFPFVPPPLAPDEEFALFFQANVDPVDEPAVVGQIVQFASGVGLPDGTPLFNDPQHPVQYFEPLDPTLPPHVPEPGTLGLLVCGMLVGAYTGIYRRSIAGRRRRRE